jgi:hypothetical protein
MKNRALFSLGISVLLGAFSAQAQFSITPLSGFGTTGAGWLAPNTVDGSTYTYLTTGTTERGLAVGDGDLFLVSRNGGNNVRILNPLTGADIGSLNTSGMSGGTFAENMVAVGGDGTVYVGNLTTSATTPFTVYAWTPGNFSSAPTVVYSGNPLGGGTRLGDDLAAIGSGASTMLVGGYGAGSSGYQIINVPSVSLNAGTTAAVSFTGSPPNAGDFRLGITFTDSSHVIGTQGSTLYRYSSFSGSTGTLLASPPLASSAERPLAYAVVGSHDLMAAISTGDNHVSVYDMTDPTNPVLLGQANATTGTLPANANATGDVAWGNILSNPDGSGSADLYAMSTADGIQAFLVVIPEPGALSLMALGLGGLAFWRRLRK